MPTIRKRNGKFQVQIRLKGAPSVTRTFESKNEAIKWAREREAEKEYSFNDRNMKYDLNITFGEMLERYYRDISSSRVWHKRERSIIRTYRKSGLYDIRIGNISEAMIAQYRDDRLKTVKSATVVREIAVASHCITVAQSDWGIKVPTNVFKMVRKPKIRNGRERRISNQEWDRIVDADSKRGDKSIIHIVEFAIETAMRKGELLRARWSEVNFSNSTLYIPVTKNEYPRTIPLTPRAIEILRAIDKKHRDEVIFSIKYGTLSAWWKALTVAASIQNCRWHDLRHEGVSRHFERGLSIPEVALISGHRDYQMLRRYTHIKPENVAEKMARLSARSE